MRNSPDEAVALNPSQSGLRDRRAVGLFDQKWNCHDVAITTTTAATASRYCTSISIGGILAAHARQGLRGRAELWGKAAQSAAASAHAIVRILVIETSELAAASRQGR